MLENGSRVVYLNNYKPGMSTADQLALGITLGHEAHRDGISGQDNYLETRSAVRGHTEMAIRMLRDGQGLSMSANLQNDIGAYMMGQDVFNAYADGSYDSSADYWKLVSTKDGQIGWQEDGSLDFNIDLNDKELLDQLRDSPDLMKTLFKNGRFNQGVSTISHTDMDAGIAQLLGSALGITNPEGVSLSTPGNSGNNFALESFVNGTLGFTQVSGIAQSMIGGSITQGNLDSLNSALMNVQNSGWLVKNSVAFAQGLNGLGTDQVPYLPLTGAVTVTCLQGERFVTQDFYDGLKEDSRENFPLNAFAENEHLHTDLWSANSDVVASVSGSLSLAYSDTWGLSGTISSATSDLSFTSNHLAGSSVMNYLSVFGMEGTSLSQNTGSYTLNGVQAGTAFGTMGNTGISGAPHVDFGISSLTINNMSFTSLYKHENYKMTDYARQFSGLTTRNWQDHKYVREYMLSVYKQQYDPIWQMMQLMY